MQKAWDEIRRLVRVNARHRKGWYLGELPASCQLAHAVCELGELLAAPDDPDELIDVLGCLFGYAAKKGWALDDLERRLLDKLAARFEGA